MPLHACTYMWSLELQEFEIIVFQYTIVQTVSYTYNWQFVQRTGHSIIEGKNESACMEAESSLQYACHIMPALQKCCRLVKTSVRTPAVVHRFAVYNRSTADDARGSVENWKTVKRHGVDSWHLRSDSVVFLFPISKQSGRNYWHGTPMEKRCHKTNVRFRSSAGCWIFWWSPMGQHLWQSRAIWSVSRRSNLSSAWI